MFLGGRERGHGEQRVNRCLRKSKDIQILKGYFNAVPIHFLV